MNKMPFQPELTGTAANAATPGATFTKWRSGLPVLTGAGFVLRGLRIEDAPSLQAMLTSQEVVRFIPPPPTTKQGFEEFITWTRLECLAGSSVCFGVVPKGMTTAVGIFQVRSLQPGFGVGDWGFALGSPFWGTGMFAEGARLVLHFAFDVLGANRLEARALVVNGRGNGALRKMGAVKEGILRRSFLCNGQFHDQALWGILVSDWRRRLADPPADSSL